MNERERFLEASALSAVGRLEPQEGAWMAEQLRLHPDWHEDVRAHAGVVRAARAAMQEDAEQTRLPSFEEALALLPAEPAARAAPAPKTRDGLLQHLQRWWQRPSTMGLALAAIACMAIIVAAQTRRVDDAELRLALATTTAPTNGPIYRGTPMLSRVPVTLRLDPAMPLGDAVQLLRQQQLVVVDGPNGDGVFLVETPADGADAKVAALRRMPQVLSAQRVAGGS